MAISRVIEVSFRGSSVALVRVDTAYFYNNGILFKPTDLDLPTTYQVHWSDSPQATTTLETIGTAEGAPIPDDLWGRSRVIYGWIYLHPTVDSGVTAYEVRIYKNVRAGLPDGTEPTPAEQSTIDQLIGALNSAVEQTGEDAESASQSAQSAESAKTAAESARDTAQGYASNAQLSATQASNSASSAIQSATASANSASASAQIKSDIEDMVDDAQSYADSASQSATASANSATSAQGYAQSASTSAQSASGYASSAQTSANTASTKASEASASASTASTKATEASQSASQALSYKTDAESAKTASQTAQGLAESARDTAVSAKTDAESARDDAESARDEAVSAVASISGALADKAPIITDTASGSIASFSDGADGLPLKSLIVDIDPIQDLHGYDSPWPAGGGKNLFQTTAQNKTENGVTWTVNADGTITVSGTATGYTDLVVGYARVSSSMGMVTISGISTATNIAWASLTVRDVNDNVLYTITTGGITAVWSCDLSQYPDAYSIRVIVKRNNNIATSGMLKIQVEKGSTATVWSPYENICPISGWTQVNVNHSDADMTNPTTITIDLGQTVYSGKLDVISGELMVDRAMVDLGTLAWALDGSRFKARIDNMANKAGRTIKMACSCFKALANGEPYDASADLVCYGAYSYVYVHDFAYTDTAAFKTAVTGQQLAYELTTPLEIQLDAHTLNSLYGQNNLWADSGDTEVEYRANTKLYIAKKIAEALASLT